MGRAPCCDKNGLKKGPWTPEEDQKLLEHIQIHGHGSWRTLPKNAGLLRCGKSCRLRWTNYLRPDIKRGRFSFEEEETIIQLHSILGNKWSAIAARLPGRTDNEIKNYWNTHIRKRLLRMGIDPVTHSPRLDLLDLSSLIGSSLYNPTRLQLSRLLGIEPLVNSEFLRLATNLFSSQNENPSLLLQNLQQNQLSSPQVQLQSPFPSLQTNQLQNPIQEIPTCATSTTQFSNTTQFDQSNAEQFLSNPPHLSFENLHPNLLQESDMPQSLDQNFMPSYNLEQSIIDPLSDDTKFPSNAAEDFNFAAIMPTPTSSPMAWNLSSACINSSASQTPLNSSSTYMNSGTEDEKDSYCSNMLTFDIPDMLDVSELW